MFIYDFSLNFDHLDLLKDDLRRRLPDIKSAHRVEAMARGFGFNTYASMRCAARAKHVVSRVQGDVFRKYLADHGFEVSANALYSGAALAAILEVAERTPDLTGWGVGVGQPRLIKGRLECVQQWEARFREERADLTSNFAIEPFLASLAFLQRVERTKTIRDGIGSYRLKHIAENFPCKFPDGEPLGPVYVSNGVLIAAAIHSGFSVERSKDDYGYDNLNVRFNMSKASVDALDCDFRPNGYQAQERRRREQMKRFPARLRTTHL